MKKIIAIALILFSSLGYSATTNSPGTAVTYPGFSDKASITVLNTNFMLICQRLDSIYSDAGVPLVTNLFLYTNRITMLADPSNILDAVNKRYFEEGPRTNLFYINYGNTNKMGFFTAGSNNLALRNTGNDGYGNLIVKDLTVTGTNNIVNVETVNVSTNYIMLDANWSNTAPILDAFFYVRRGTESNAVIKWDETTERWYMGTDTNLIDVTLQISNNVLDIIALKVATNALTASVTALTTGTNNLQTQVTALNSSTGAIQTQVTVLKTATNDMQIKMTYIETNAVYISSNQTFTGTNTFQIRPTLNGTNFAIADDFATVFAYVGSNNTFNGTNYYNASNIFNGGMAYFGTNFTAIVTSNASDFAGIGSFIGVSDRVVNAEAGIVSNVSAVANVSNEAYNILSPKLDATSNSTVSARTVADYGSNYGVNIIWPKLNIASQNVDTVSSLVANAIIKYDVVSQNVNTVSGILNNAITKYDAVSNFWYSFGITNNASLTGMNIYVSGKIDMQGNNITNINTLSASNVVLRDGTTLSNSTDIGSTDIITNNVVAMTNSGTFWVTNAFINGTATIVTNNTTILNMSGDINAGNYNGTNFAAIGIGTNANGLGLLVLGNAATTNTGIRFGGTVGMPHLWNSSGYISTPSLEATTALKASLIYGDTAGLMTYRSQSNSKGNYRWQILQGNQTIFSVSNLTGSAQTVLASGVTRDNCTNALIISAGTNALTIGDTGPVSISNVTSIIGNGSGITNYQATNLIYVLTNRTVSITTNQATIEAENKYIHPGTTLTFQLANGTNQMPCALQWQGFGPGHLVVQGNVSEANATVLHTNQTVTMNATNLNNYAFIFQGNFCESITLRNITLWIPFNTSYNGVKFADNSAHCDLSYCWLRAYDSVGHSGVYYWGARGKVLNTYFTAGTHAINAGNLAYVLSSGSTNVWTQQSYGLGCYGGIILKDGGQPSGSVANEYKANGGQIF